MLFLINTGEGTASLNRKVKDKQIADIAMEQERWIHSTCKELFLYWRKRCSRTCHWCCARSSKEIQTMRVWCYPKLISKIHYLRKFKKKDQSTKAHSAKSVASPPSEESDSDALSAKTMTYARSVRSRTLTVRSMPSSRLGSQRLIQQAMRSYSRSLQNTTWSSIWWEWERK